MFRFVIQIVPALFAVLAAVAAAGTEGSSSMNPQSTWNVRDFGALGDAVADDAPAFRKALQSAADAGGGTVFAPAARAARTAVAASVVSLMVSTRIASAPPARSAAACSSNTSAAVATAISPYGSSRAPSGPMSPSTQRPGPATRRAITAPARLISTTRSVSPCRSSASRVPPKVFVVIRSQPASA